MMPPLPRVLKKVEAGITTRRIPAFLKSVFPYNYVCFEVKRRGRKVEPHQRHALEQAHKNGYYKKFRDDGSKQDFDGIWMPLPVCVIIWIEKDGSITIEKVEPLT